MNNKRTLEKGAEEYTVHIDFARNIKAGSEEEAKRILKEQLILLVEEVDDYIHIVERPVINTK